MQHADALTRRRPSVGLVLVMAAIIVAGSAMAVAVANWSIAFFTSQLQRGNDIGTALIFRGDRDTPAFTVGDSSSGSVVDRSSALAYPADGRWFTSRSWSAGFAASRYLELDLNHPLPGGLAVSGSSLALTVAADSAVTSCYYIEIRSAASGSLISTHGSAGSPLACVTGTTFATTNTTLAAIDTTGEANDLRVRIYASDSGAGSLRVDRLTVSGSTPYSSFVLYPVLSRDVDASDVQLIKWELAN